MTTLASAVAIGDNALSVNAPMTAARFPGFVQIDSEFLKVGGQEYKAGTTLVLSEPAQAAHNSGATVTYAGRAFDPTFVSALGAGGGAAEPGTVVVTPPLEVDVIAALEAANAPDGSNPVATLDDIPAKDFYASDTDPGAVGAGSVWKDTSALPSETWWRRNITDDGWDADFSPRVIAVGDATASTGVYAATSGAGAAFAGSGADASGEGGASIAGMVSTAGTGTASAGRTVAAMGAGGLADATDLVSATSAEATAGFSVTSTTGTLSLLARSDGGDGDGLQALTLTGVPTTEGGADEVWNNDGLVMLSGGSISIPAAAVDDLSLTVSDPPTQAEVQAIADTVDLLLASLVAAGLLAT